MTTEPTTAFTARLREESHAGWHSTINHRFVTEIFAGTIDDAVLLRYLIQDYQFFDAFMQLLGAAVAAAPTAPARLRLARQIGMLASEENSYYNQTLNHFDVPLSERLEPRLACETVDLLDLMYEAGGSGSWPQVLTVLVAAEWIYLDWADNPEHTGLPEKPEHRGWIELHRGHAFRDWVMFLRQQLDHAEPDDPDQYESCHDLFRRMVLAELAFFDAAYADPDPCEVSPIEWSVPEGLAADLNTRLRERTDY